jgi:hypothetical protein
MVIKVYDGISFQICIIHNPLTGKTLQILLLNAIISMGMIQRMNKVLSPESKILLEYESPCIVIPSKR